MFEWYLFGPPPRHDTSSPLVFGSLYRETQKTRFVCCFLSPLNSITKLHQHQLPSEVLPTGMSSPNFVTAFSWREYSYLLSSTANTGSTIFFFVEPTLWLSWLLAKTVLKYGQRVRYIPSVSYPVRDFLKYTFHIIANRWFSQQKGAILQSVSGFSFPSRSIIPGEIWRNWGPRFRVSTKSTS